MQPFIVFGTRSRITDQNSGDFFCPHCNTPRRYTQKRARQYFTLYWVPIFPIEQGQEFVECQTCGRAFSLDVLKMKAPIRKKEVPPLSEQLNTLADRLMDGSAIEYVVADLTATGLDRDLAIRYVINTIGRTSKQCPQCNLHYAESVTQCSADGTALG